jgi:hypothetical protein
MRFARPVLVALLLTLTFAPAARAHGDDEPNHRDTPAELAAADIGRTLAVAHLASTTAPDLPEFLPTTWCGTELHADDTVHAAFPSAQRQIKVVYAYANDQPADFAPGSTAVSGGREVRTAAARVALPAGTWRLRLCAGPTRGGLRCALSSRVRTRHRGGRLPITRVVARGASGGLRVTAAAVDGHRRTRAKGQAASA